MQSEDIQQDPDEGPDNADADALRQYGLPTQFGGPKAKKVSTLHMITPGSYPKNLHTNLIQAHSYLTTSGCFSPCCRQVEGAGGPVEQRALNQKVLARLPVKVQLHCPSRRQSPLQAAGSARRAATQDGVQRQMAPSGLRAQG